MYNNIKYLLESYNIELQIKRYVYIWILNFVGFAPFYCY